MKLITRDTDYAARALAFMAKEGEGVFSVGRLSEKLKVPRPFLRKILQVLHKKGLLAARKGREGGFWLARPAEKIFLMDLWRVFQGSFTLNECNLESAPCPRIGYCPLRRKLKGIERYVERQLKPITVASLLRG
ncbi:MAG: Rrf2 family transcriptional regulator [Candidatus Omnitrophota bacterium]|nr:Rrf2 family transcriptional regulator [Candidatus Omnitrophota bacterium]